MQSAHAVSRFYNHLLIIVFVCRNILVSLIMYDMSYNFTILQAQYFEAADAVCVFA